MDELIKRRFTGTTDDDELICFLNAIEVAILALSRNPAATDELLSILCEAYAACYNAHDCESAEAPED